MTLPYCTYTDPEIATIGVPEGDVYTKHFSHNDRALCESNNGLYKIYCKKGTDHIVGASLCGGPAGDLISHVSMAMFNNIGLSKMGGCVYPYPSYAESFRNMADEYNRTNLKPAVKCIIRGLLEFKS